MEIIHYKDMNWGKLQGNIGNDWQNFMNFGFAYLSTVGFGSVSVFKNLEITVSVFNVSKPWFRFAENSRFRFQLSGISLKTTMLDASVGLESKTCINLE